MPSCAAPNCSNRSERDGKRRITFHRLPFKRKDLAKKWLVKLGHEKKFLPKPKNIYVCSNHFTEECFEIDFKYQLLAGNNVKRKLKPEAVPTVFKHKSPAKRRLASERRKAIKERQEASSSVFRAVTQENVSCNLSRSQFC